jgi:hypothetical protein
MGCCLLALASWISPRFVIFLMWLLSDRLSSAFDHFWQGLLGFLIVPWTTLFFALAYAPDGRGVTGIGWLFVGFGILCDIVSWTGGGRSAQMEQRRRTTAV